DRIDGRAVLIQQPVGYRIAHGGQIPFAQGWVFVRNFREPIHERHDGHARRPDFRTLGETHHGHVSAVAAAHDGDAIAADVARPLDDAGRLLHVAQIPPAHVETVALLEVLAISGGPAIIWRDHDVTIVNQILHAAIEAVHVLRRRPAVHVD